MRKFVLSVLALFVCVGLTIAAQVTFVKYDADKKEVTVKEGDSEKTYKITDSTKVLRGEKEADLTKTLKQWEKNGEKMSGKAKMNVKVEKGNVVEIKLPEAKKKNNN